MKNVFWLSDIIVTLIILAITCVVIYILWKAVRYGYKKTVIETLLTRTSDKNKDDVSSPSITQEQELLNQSSQVSSNIRSYKDREIISDYKDYADYKKQQERQQEIAKMRKITGSIGTNGTNGYTDYDDYPEIIYKPLDVNKKPKIKDPSKFFKSSEPEIDMRKAWDQKKIDVAQIPNSEMCVKNISGQDYDCGVAAANTHVYNDIM